jgi:hypothetical protein
MCNNFSESFFIFTLSPEFARNTFARNTFVRKVRSYLSVYQTLDCQLIEVYFICKLYFRYGLEGLESNPGRGEIFRTCSALGTTQPPIQRVRIYFRGGSFPAGFEVKERVELYICFSSGLAYSIKLSFHPISEGL